MSSGKITLEQRKASLHYHVQEYRKRRVIIDTDAACEADDPFAIAQALMSKMLEVKGICAEHFVAEGSMEQSYEMICRVTEAMGADVPVLRGQTGKMSEHQGKPMTEAAQFIIEEAMKEDDKPLFVLCIGAVTNVAEAIRAKSEIVDRMTVVCIGGNPIGCEKPGWEFNFGNDVEAANTVLHCGGDIWMIPNNVYGTMHIGFGEIQRRIAPYGGIGRLLYENLISFYETENASWSAGESWSLGDSPAVGVTLEPNCGSFMYCKAPEVQEDTSYRYPENSPQIRVYTLINSRFIIEDFISKLQILYG